MAFKESLAVFLVLSAAIFVLYVNALDNSFHYDDFHSFVNNRHISRVENIPTFFLSTHMFSSSESAFRDRAYRPVLLTTYALNYWFGGLNPRGYRLFNLTLHILTCFVFFLLVREMSGNKKVALLSALFFAITPFNTEVINYISSRSTLLATLFSLLCLYFHVRLRSSGLLRFYFLSLSCLFLALGSKQIAVMVPLILFAYDCYFLPAHDRGLKRFLAPYFIYIAGGLVYFTAFDIFGLIGEIVAGGGIRSISSNLLTQSVVTLKYIRLFFLPYGLSIDHDIRVITTLLDLEGILGLLMNFALLGSIVMLYIYKRKILSFFMLFFYIASVPTIVVPLNIQLFENRGYFPLVGMAVAAGFFLEWLLKARGRVLNRVVKVCVVCYLVISAFMVMQRNQDWETEETLWKSVLRTNSKSFKAHASLGSFYDAKGEPDKAIREYKKAIKLDPTYFIPYIKIGIIYYNRGDYDRAGELYSKALEINGDYAIAHYNLGLIYHRTAQLDKAEKAYSRTLEIDPHHFMAHYNLGNLYIGKKEYATAIIEFKAAIRENPDFVDVYYNIATVYDTLGQADEALENYRRFIRGASVDYMEHINLARSRVNYFANKL